MSTMRLLVLSLCGLLMLGGCQRMIAGEDAGTPQDSGGGGRDAGPPPVDSGPVQTDSGLPTDAGPLDAGPTDAGPTDAGPTDAGADAGMDDGGADGGTDDAGVDAGMDDAGVDAGMLDAGPGMTVFFPLDDTTFMDDTSMTVEDLDDAMTLTLTVSGVSMTLMASDGTLNQTATGFGINHSGAGDDTDGIDGDAGVETLTITFGVDVSLTELDLSSLSGSDEAAIAINGGSPITATASGVVDLGGAALSAGQTVTLTHVAGNGFQFDSITITIP